MSVVVGYTPSAQGGVALAAAVRQSGLLSTGLVVVSHAFAETGGATAVADDAEVRAALAAAGGQGIRASVTVDGERDAGELLLAVAERVGAQLIVIGLRRKSPIGKLNLGASARRVVLEAPCPVLAVKEPPVDHAEPRD